MGLCLVDIHGDIEGDYEYIKDLCNMTNGEVIMATFAIKEIHAMVRTIFAVLQDGTELEFNRNWWNEPYKEIQ